MIDKNKRSMEHPFRRRQRRQKASEVDRWIAAGINRVIADWQAAQLKQSGSDQGSPTPDSNEAVGKMSWIGRYENRLDRRIKQLKNDQPQPSQKEIDMSTEIIDELRKLRADDAKSATLADEATQQGHVKQAMELSSEAMRGASKEFYRLFPDQLELTRHQQAEVFRVGFLAAGCPEPTPEKCLELADGVRATSLAIARENACLARPAFDATCSAFAQFDQWPSRTRDEIALLRRTGAAAATQLPPGTPRSDVSSAPCQPTERQ